MDKWEKLPNKKTVEKTISTLKANNIESYYFNTSEEAKKKIFEILPENAEVMNMTSVTLETMNIANEIQESRKYNSVRKKLMSMDRKTQGREMQKIGATPDWTIGSVHAVTEEGQVLIASNTGSQLPAYAYGSSHVIWVVGTQKIVKNIDQGIKRVYEHSLPLESERAKKAYGVPGSFVSKILIVNKEISPGRVVIIFINEKLGF
ncbi:MAG: LUD domain-containing protein [Nanoarchaeota archaeon]